MNVNDLQEFKTMIDGVDYEDGSEVSKWFEACGDASEESDSEEGTKYLIKASNFVGSLRSRMAFGNRRRRVVIISLSSSMTRMARTVCLH